MGDVTYAVDVPPDIGKCGIWVRIAVPILPVGRRASKDVGPAGRGISQAVEHAQKRRGIVTVVGKAHTWTTPSASLSRWKVGGSTPDPDDRPSLMLEVHVAFQNPLVPELRDDA